MKFVESMTHKQRMDAANGAVVIEGAVALVQVAIAMATGHAGNWFAAMFAIVIGAIAWAILTPEETDE